MLKSQVRKIASDLGLDRVHRKKSSVGICFIGKRKFADFINEYVPSEPGLIVNLESGKPLGEHQGIHHFTLGQRIVIDEKLNGKKEAFYVAKKDLVQKIIYAVAGTNHPALYSDQFEIDKPHWICENKENDSNEIILDENYEFKYQNKHYQSKIKYLKKVLCDSDFKYYVKTDNYFRAIPKGQVRL